MPQDNPRKHDPAASTEWQQLSETQKAYEEAKRKRHRRGVSIAPSDRPGGQDEITIEPEDEGATPAAAEEYVEQDVPLETPPDSKKDQSAHPNSGPAQVDAARVSKRERAIEEEYVAQDAPLEAEPESRSEKNHEAQKKPKKGAATVTRSLPERSEPEQSEESNRVHGGAVKPRK